MQTTMQLLRTFAAALVALLAATSAHAIPAPPTALSPVIDKLRPILARSEITWSLESFGCDEGRDVLVIGGPDRGRPYFVLTLSIPARLESEVTAILGPPSHAAFVKPDRCMLGVAQRDEIQRKAWRYDSSVDVVRDAADSNGLVYFAIGIRAPITSTAFRQVATKLGAPQCDVLDHQRPPSALVWSFASRHEFAFDFELPNTAKEAAEFAAKLGRTFAAFFKAKGVTRSDCATALTCACAANGICSQWGATDGYRIGCVREVQ